MNGLSWDAYRKNHTRKNHRWHILRIVLEQGATQVFEHRMGLGIRVLVVSFVPAFVLNLYLGDKQVKFSEHNQGRH